MTAGRYTTDPTWRLIHILILINTICALPCPSVRWSRLGNRCYRGYRYPLGDLVDRNWNTARAACRSLGADLVSIGDASESVGVDLVRKIAGLRDDNYFWIGLTDEEEEGRFRWSDGTALAYHHWATGEPDSANPINALGAIEDYVIASGSHRWRDVRDDWSLAVDGRTEPSGYVCEIAVAGTSGDTDPSPSYPRTPHPSPDQSSGASGAEAPRFPVTVGQKETTTVPSPVAARVSPEGPEPQPYVPTHPPGYQGDVRASPVGPMVESPPAVTETSALPLYRARGVSDGGGGGGSGAGYHGIPSSRNPSLSDANTGASSDSSRAPSGSDSDNLEHQRRHYNTLEPIPSYSQTAARQPGAAAAPNPSDEGYHGSGHTAPGDPPPPARAATPAPPAVRGLPMTTVPRPSPTESTPPPDNPTIPLSNSPSPRIGPRGPPGLRGERGYEGTAGRPGPSGRHGAQGPPGTPGLTGPQGRSGPPGSRGSSGPPGPQGAVGPKGDKGDRGDPGQSGPPGAEGSEPGPPGTPGQPGAKGDHGVRGPPGRVGQPGEMGPAGPPGPPGPGLVLGRSGTSPDVGLELPSRGPPGWPTGSYINAAEYCRSLPAGLHPHPLHCWQYVACGDQYRGDREHSCLPQRRFQLKKGACMTDPSCVFGAPNHNITKSYMLAVKAAALEHHVASPVVDTESELLRLERNLNLYSGVTIGVVVVIATLVTIVVHVSVKKGRHLANRIFIPPVSRMSHSLDSGEFSTSLSA